MLRVIEVLLVITAALCGVVAFLVVFVATAHTRRKTRELKMPGQPWGVESPRLHILEGSGIRYPETGTKLPSPPTD